MSDKQTKINYMIEEAGKHLQKIIDIGNELKVYEKEDSLELPYNFLSYDNWYDCILDHKMPFAISKGLHLKNILQERKLYAQLKLQYIADKLNDGWVPDWYNREEKCYIFYSHQCVEWDVGTRYNSEDITTYFKSEELAQRALEIMGSDMGYLK